jgi:LDH2 family malate/lactate/ureidoglycolate dehydrogenase
MLVAELFAATWSDSPVTPQPDSRYENSAAFTVFDPLAFTTREAHEARLVALEEYLDETDYSDAISAGTGTRADRAYLPGRREHEVKSEYEAEGIPVPDRIRETLAELAREYGVEEEVVALVAPE